MDIHDKCRGQMAFRSYGKRSYSASIFFQTATLDVLHVMASFLVSEDLLSVWCVSKLMNQLHLMPRAIVYRMPKYNDANDFVLHKNKCKNIAAIPEALREQVHSIDFCPKSNSHGEMGYSLLFDDQTIVVANINEILRLFPRLNSIVLYNFEQQSQVLKVFPNITDVTLVGPTGYFSFDGLIKDCQHITALATYPIDDGFGSHAFKEICELRNLENLKILCHGAGGDPNVSDEDFSNLLNLKSLKILELEGLWLEITEGIYETLNQLPNLTKVILNIDAENLSAEVLRENLHERVDLQIT